MMTSGNGVPFVDLVTPHLELEKELLEAIGSVVRSGAFIGAPVIEEFEKEFARTTDVAHCVGVSSGTDALRFALLAAGVEPGQIVVTVANTFVATIEAISQTGAIPRFVDVSADTFNMSVEALSAYLQTECVESGGVLLEKESGRRVKAVVPVHLYGQMCDMDPITALGEQYGLIIIEDACQAHGSRYYSKARNEWLAAGSVGKVAAFSFYVAKNLGACGEAGAVTTNDDSIAQRVRAISDHGQVGKYHHVVEGYNGRLDAIQAAVLGVKLPRLVQWNEQRRAAAVRYAELLQGIEGVHAPTEPQWGRPVYHLYVVQVENRDDLRAHLTASGIGTGLHYPVPLHLQPAFAHLGYRKGDFPVTEALAGTILSLPMFPQIQPDQQERVVDVLREFLESRVAIPEKSL